MQVAWHRGADSRRLEERFEEVAAGLRALGGAPTYPITEEALYKDRAALARLKAAVQPPRDEMLLAAKSEFRAACHRHRHAVTAINDALSKLERYRRNEIYLLLFNMDEVLRPPVSTQETLDRVFGGCRECTDLYLLRLPEFATVADYRSAMNTMSDLARDLEAQQATMTTITAFPGEETKARTDRMVTALVKRINELERLAVRNAQLLNLKIDRIESRIERVASHAKYIRKHRRKSK
jgi:hypothetical protein